MKKLLLIDADGLVYHSSKDSLEESLLSIDERIQNMFKKTEATHYIMFISNSPYFRHKIDSNYKSNRSKYESPLKWLKCLKSYLIEKWNAQWMNLVEADDLVAYWYNEDLIYGYVNEKDNKNIFYKLTCVELGDCLEEVTKIICSPDKDILQNMPGRHFNYSYKIKEESKSKSKELLTDSDFNKGWWIETSVEGAYISFWKSMICGDVPDGIKGIEGKGEAYFKKICEKYSQYGNTFEELIPTEYINKYGISQGIYEFQKNYRLLRLLDCDEDFIREVGVLPKFPVITEVPKQIEINQVIDI